MKKSLLLSVVICVFAGWTAAQGAGESIVLNARAMQREGNYAAAAEEMNKALALDPDNTKYLFEQSQYYALAKDNANFLKDIDRALALQPDDEATVLEAVRRLFTYAAEGRCERSLNVVNSYLVNHTRSDQAYHWRFIIKQCLHDDQGAFLDVAMFLGQLALVYERDGDKTQSIEMRTQAIVYDENGYQRRAEAYSRFGMYPEALADINRAIGDDDEKWARFKNLPAGMPRSTILYEARGDIFYKSGEYQKAIDDYNECIRRNPRNKALYDKLIDRASQKISTPE